MVAPEILGELAHKYFENRCEVTLKKYKPKGFVIHHVRYIEDDIERSQYPYTPVGAKDYYTALEDMIKKDRTRFAMITNGIHGKLDNHRHGVCRLNEANRLRFCDLAMRTIPKPSGRKRKN